MKRIMVKGLYLAAIVFMASCNSETKSDADTTTDTMTNAGAATMTDSAAVATTTTPRDPREDTTFAMKAAVGGMMEVQLAQVALKNASSATVKHHAQMMITDHGKANGELKSLATTKNIMLPTALPEDKKKKVDEFKAKKGTDFDKAYTDFMVDDHQQDIELFKKEADNGADTDLKAWAAGKLPTLQQHLDMWQSAKDGKGSVTDTAKK